MLQMAALEASASAANMQLLENKEAQRLKSEYEEKTGRSLFEIATDGECLPRSALVADGILPCEDPTIEAMLLNEKRQTIVHSMRLNELKKIEVEHSDKFCAIHKERDSRRRQGFEENATIASFKSCLTIREITLFSPLLLCQPLEPWGRQ